MLKSYLSITEPRPLIALAPMAGVCDQPFRRICERLGADYSISEMAASAPQLLQSSKNQTRLHFSSKSPVKIIQIIGNDAEQMALSSQHYAKLGADIIDINLGCPAKKVNRKGAGSALLANLPLVEKILTAVVKTCPVPVTVKTRLGIDKENYCLLEIGKIAENLGIDLLTVHGRSKASGFRGKAQFEPIAELKQNFPKLTVIANGDIDSLDKARQVIHQTHCDGVMIGRAAIGNPWLFTQIRAYFDTGFDSPKIDKKTLILEHIHEIHQFYGGLMGVRFARKHIQGYLKHLGLAGHFPIVAKVRDSQQQLQLLREFLIQ